MPPPSPTGPSCFAKHSVDRLLHKESASSGAASPSSSSSGASLLDTRKPPVPAFASRFLAVRASPVPPSAAGIVPVRLNGVTPWLAGRRSVIDGARPPVFPLNRATDGFGLLVDQIGRWFFLPGPRAAYVARSSRRRASDAMRRGCDPNAHHPGISGSEAGRWQRHWASGDPKADIVEQEDVASAIGRKG